MDRILHNNSAGKWYKDRIVWAGDYIEDGLFLEYIKGKRKSDHCLYGCTREQESKRTAAITLVNLVLQYGPAPELILNHDAKGYVKLTSLPEEDPRDLGWHLHPLPLLTCCGNGRDSSILKITGRN